MEKGPRERDSPDERVDLDGLNVVHLLERLLDLCLVGLHVDDEDKGVVLLDLKNCIPVSNSCFRLRIAGLLP